MFSSPLTLLAVSSIMVINKTDESESLGFWTLSINRNFKYKRKQHFGNWICFCPQVSGRLVQQLRLALSKGPNRVGVSPSSSPEDGSRSSFWNMVFSCILNSRRWSASRNTVILSVIHQCHNPSKTDDDTFFVTLLLVLNHTDLLNFATTQFLKSLHVRFTHSVTYSETFNHSVSSTWILNSLLCTTFLLQ
jgi:hypothetical protein